jgi:hypothetical protein
MIPCAKGYLFPPKGNAEAAPIGAHSQGSAQQQCLWQSSMKNPMNSDVGVLWLDGLALWEVMGLPLGWQVDGEEKRVGQKRMGILLLLLL